MVCILLAASITRSLNSQQQVDKQQGSKSSFGYTDNIRVVGVIIEQQYFGGRSSHTAAASSLLFGRCWHVLKAIGRSNSCDPPRSNPLTMGGFRPPDRPAITPMMTLRPPPSHPDSLMRRAEHLIIIKTDLQQRHIG